MSAPRPALHPHPHVCLDFGTLSSPPPPPLPCTLGSLPASPPHSDHQAPASSRHHPRCCRDDGSPTSPPERMPTRRASVCLGRPRWVWPARVLPPSRLPFPLCSDTHSYFYWALTGLRPGAPCRGLQGDLKGTVPALWTSGVGARSPHPIPPGSQHIPSLQIKTSRDVSLLESQPLLLRCFL